MKIRSLVAGTIAGCILTNLAACGTILYPERKGQVSGRVDVGVAVLDGIGLLFFIIPGVIAFAVDFSNGTIYLPGGHRGAIDNGHDVSAIKATQKIDIAYLEQVVQQQTGVKAHLDSDSVKVVEMSSLDEAKLKVEQYSGSLLALR